MAAASSPLIGISELMKNLAPIFLGSGTSTTTDSTSGGTTTGSSTTSSSAQALADNQKVIDDATANANDPNQVSLIVNDIMTKAAQAFAPTVGQQNNAGMYNTSSLALLSAAAQGEATRSASQAVLNYKTSQQQIAQAASGNLLQATKTATTTSTAPATVATKSTVAKPAIDPMSAILTAGSAFALSKGSKLLGLDKLTDKAGDYLNTNVAQPIQDLFGVGPDAAADSAHVFDVASGGSPLLQGFQPVDTGVAAEEAATSGVDISLADSLAGDVGGSVAENVAGNVAEDVGSNVAEDVAAPVAEDVASNVAEDAGGDVASTAADGWIVCTELVRQGRLPKRYWIAGLKEFDGYSDTIKRGYYLLAIPAVHHLRRHPYSLRSRFLCVLFNRRVEYIAARLGMRGARDTLIGQLSCYGLLPIGWILGTFIQREMPDWNKEVYSHG
jgi:hypothetical protein